MAKVGNEAKLILSLAAEKVKGDSNLQVKMGQSRYEDLEQKNCYEAGFKAAVRFYEATLNGTVHELESR
jgi:hypothetical protein